MKLLSEDIVISRSRYNILIFLLILLVCIISLISLISLKDGICIISYVTTKVTARQINLPVSPFHPDLKIRGYLPPALFSVLFATASNPGIRFNFVQKADAICCHCAYFHPLRSQPYGARSATRGCDRFLF
ncbi:hypothetical protein [Microseira wollei]|uniref:hypothetical protein n=1 Tax=Microseira wollei TaxID=467598 RepID=UPI001CFF08E2|nr:hypothetical protein [Microseira wollei]